MAWINLAIAGLLEIAWAIGLKYTAGFTRLRPSIFTVAAMVASFYFLAQALKTIPVGTGCVRRESARSGRLVLV
jgi:quaternary ammonium compound-resistance protein SugE